MAMEQERIFICPADDPDGAVTFAALCDRIQKLAALHFPSRAHGMDFDRGDLRLDGDLDSPDFRGSLRLERHPHGDAGQARAAITLRCSGQPRGRDWQYPPGYIAKAYGCIGSLVFMFLSFLFCSWLFITLDLMERPYTPLLVIASWIFGLIIGFPIGRPIGRRLERRVTAKKKTDYATRHDISSWKAFLHALDQLHDAHAAAGTP